MHEHGNIVQSLGQTGNANFDGAETIEKIFAETAGQDFGAQIPVGSRDEANVHTSDLRRTNALNFAILNHTQQFSLHAERCFSHFVQEYRAMIRVFEQAGPSVRGAGERTTHMTEKLAFQERIHHG